MQKKLKGIVVGCFSSTAKVRVYTLSKHRRYGKYISSWSGILVDIPAGLSVSVGQSVLIVEGRPMSKLKCWSIVAVV